MKALESDDPAGEEAKCVFELMDAIDSFIPEPQRDVDKPFLMPIEDVFSISGRGTVVTGRVERGIVKVGEEIEVKILRVDTEDRKIGLSRKRVEWAEEEETADERAVVPSRPRVTRDGPSRLVELPVPHQIIRDINS